MWREYNNTGLNNAQGFLCLHLDNTHNRIVDVLEDKAGRCQVLGIRQEICPEKTARKLISEPQHSPDSKKKQFTAVKWLEYMALHPYFRVILRPADKPYCPKSEGKNSVISSYRRRTVLSYIPNNEVSWTGILRNTKPARTVTVSTFAAMSGLAPGLYLRYTVLVRQEWKCLGPLGRYINGFGPHY